MSDNIKRLFRGAMVFMMGLLANSSIWAETRDVGPDEEIPSPVSTDQDNNTGITFRNESGQSGFVSVDLKQGSPL